MRAGRTPRVFAFIDNQNLNLGIQRAGWKMDWRKFREWLREEHGVTQAFMFIGYMKEHEELYTQMYEAGYNVLLKPTVGMFNTAEENKEQDNAPKGNVDVDLVLEAMKQWRKYDKAVIISGDGDFYTLIEHLRDKEKLGSIMVPNWKYSSLLKEFDSFLIRLDEQRSTLAYRDYKNRRKNTKKPTATKGRTQAKAPAKPANKPKPRGGSAKVRPVKPRQKRPPQKKSS